MNTLNFIRLEELSKEDLDNIFRIADEINSGKEYNILSGKNAILFFPELSIRTRITFELAVKELGGNLINFPPESLDKRERICDVAGYISNWINLAIIRHPNINLIEEFARSSNFPVINAMTKENHPCEILSDLYTIKNKYKQLNDLKISFVGIKGNICNSWFAISKVLNFKITQICPIEYRIDEKYFLDNQNAKHSDSLDEVKESDIVLTDSLPNDKEIQEKMKKYQVTLDVMKKTKENSILNPCPPFNIGEEIDEAVINSKYFVGYEFKKNLLTVQKAIIIYCMNKKSTTYNIG